MERGPLHAAHGGPALSRRSRFAARSRPTWLSPTSRLMTVAGIGAF